MHSETSNCRFAAKPGMCDLRSFLRDQSFFIAQGEEGEGGWGFGGFWFVLP